MREFETAGRHFRFQWASHPDIDGLRLEAIDGDDVVLDVTVPVTGPISINTFGHDLPAELVKVAVDMAVEDRRGWR
jgi:hypothetical protein